MPNIKKVTKVTVRMYRLGTGDFFLLQFKNGDSVKYNLMLDCGCIQGNKKDFTEKVNDLKKKVNGVIDLLVVTHEHADHINGFEKAKDVFKEIDFKKVWFAWTEGKDDEANKFRKEHTKASLAIKKTAEELNKLMLEGSFKKMYENEFDSNLMLEANNHFVEALNGLNELNFRQHTLSAKAIPTMEDILRDNNVIKDSTDVKFWEPGQVIEEIKGLEGIRFFILGPPKKNEYLKMEEVKEEGYEKRKKPSTFNLSLISLVAGDDASDESMRPFESEFESTAADELQKSYKDKDNNWRNIDNDWLLSAGSLALRHETSINNTSLVMAIQFIDSERILLFPGDAEHGNWLSWHLDGLKWKFKDGSKTREVDSKYILENTVFYKVGHHLSQNGTAKRKGLEMMKSDDFSAMATLDFKKINEGWKNTMPNDLIGAELLRKTKGKLFFVGDRKRILKNIKTNRVNLNDTDLKKLEKLNKPFDGKFYIDFDVSG